LIVAIIPARGGSQRIPSKNIKDFCGKPIIAHSIEVAQASLLFDDIIVSTDDPKIAAVARNAGASVPFVRPAEIADEYTGTNAVVKHALQWLLDQGHQLDYACCIYATAPLLRESYLRQGLERLQASDKMFAFSVASFPFSIYRALEISEQGSLKPRFPDYAETRSQDLKEHYHDAGQFYWGRPEAFLDELPLYSDISIPIQLPRHLVQDIDTNEDWVRAELMHAALQQRLSEDESYDRL
jgi:N-acylneuraminate cytidylyltransferase